MAGNGTGKPAAWPGGRDSLLRIAGFTCNRAWILLMFFSGVLFQNAASDSLLRTNSVYSSSVTVLAVSLALFAVFHAHVLRGFSSRLFPFAGPAISAVGVFILMAALSPGPFSEAFLVWMSALGTGAGSALTLLYVGRYYAAVGGRQCIQDTLVASVLAPLLSMLVMQFPFWAAAATIVVFPFLAVKSLQLINLSRMPEEADAPLFSTEVVSVQMLVRFAVCASVLGILMGVLHFLVLATGNASVSGTFHALAFALDAAAPLVLYLAFRIERHPGIDTLYRPTVLIITIGYALLPAIGDYIAVSYLIVNIGYMLFEILIWVILSEVAHRFQYTSVQVFGFGRALTLASGVIAGEELAHLSLSGPDGLPSLSIISAVAIIAIVFVRSYVLASSHVRSLEQGLAGSGADEAADDNPRAEDDCWQAGTDEGAADKADQLPTSKMPLWTKCRIIGEYYGLTARETEVFHLLAIGRNSARIQEELVVSAGTVNTHTHHIFQKLDIHTQQDLIDLFVNADLDALQQEIATRK